jgi:hypothetical protein
MIARHARWVVGGVFAAVFAALVLAGTTTRADDKKDKLDLDKIPKKVMDALKAKFPKAEIHKWSKEKEGGDVVYDIEFKVDGRKFEADIKEDGTLFEYEKEIEAKDLPKAVKETVEKKYPKSTLKEIMEITHIKEKKETLHGYEIILVTEDKKELEVTVAPDGKILEEPKEEKK